MKRVNRSFSITLVALAGMLIASGGLTARSPQAPAPQGAHVITADDCTSARLGTTIPVSAIGEPVRGVTLAEPRWVAAAGNTPAYCSVDGSMAPTDTGPNGRPINFRVALPASWTSHAVQLGGGGMNGSIPGLTGGEGATLLQRGFATYGSDSGHQQGGFGGGPGGPGGLGGPGGPGRGGAAGPGGPGGRGGPRAGGPAAGPGGQGGPRAGGPAGGPGGQGGPRAGGPAGGPAAGPGGPGGPRAGGPAAGPGGQGGPRAGGPGGPAGAGGGAGNDWALSDEAIKNLGYMQMKKTHDAAMVLMERLYGERPRYNYYVGSSQGGREALTVAQRYPADYNGIAANVPIVNFSSLMLAPEWIRIQEKPAANWVPPAKVEAIRAEFIRQCDKLDGLADGVMNNYMACRAIFDMSQGDPNRNPWASKRCPNNVDPNPEDRSAEACFTDGQIATLKMVYSRYKFATTLANGVKSFGMWVPNIDPSGSGLIQNARFKGQEGAAPNAQNHSHLGILGVTGFLMKDLNANPLDYVEGGPLNKRREEISAWLDSTNPDLSAFAKRGGKMIVAIGTNDTLASPGAQLDYYQSVLDKMGRAAVDEFARFYVIPQTGHGLTGSSYTKDGDGRTIQSAAIPSRFDRVAMLLDWVEKGSAPAKAATVTGNTGSLPLCSYPAYPRYNSGAPTEAASYTCAER